MKVYLVKVLEFGRAEDVEVNVHSTLELAKKEVEGSRGSYWDMYQIYEVEIDGWYSKEIESGYLDEEDDQ